MNCKEAQLLIAGLTGDELPDTLSAHVCDCVPCADLLKADAQIRATLRSSEHLPSVYVLGRIRQEMVALPPSSWLERLKGNKIMKIYLPTAALLALTFALLPRPVDAATPRATFAKMKKAILASTKQSTQFEVKIRRKPDGSVGGWVVLNGELTELPSNGTLHFDKDNKNITVNTHSVGGDLSSLPPDVREKVKQVIANAKEGKSVTTTTHYQVNGEEVDAETANRYLQKAGIDLKISVDLDESHYRSIAFGSDENHLLLNPVKAKDQRYVVTLDPKSGLPQNVVLQKQDKGKWVALRESNIVLK